MNYFVKKIASFIIVLSLCISSFTVVAHTKSNLTQQIIQNEQIQKSNIVKAGVTLGLLYLALIITVIIFERSKWWINLSFHTECDRDDPNLGKITRFLNKGADINSQFYQKRTVLHKACKTHKLNLIRFLLDKEASLDIKDEENNTPLHDACINGQEEIVKLLVEKSANLELYNNHTCTPLLETYIKALNIRNRSAINNNLYFNIAKYLIEKGANINVKQRRDEGNTILHETCYKGYLDYVQYLVEHGADINIKNDRGQTPLYIACEKGHIEIARYLISQGANPHCSNDTNQKMLFALLQEYNDNNENKISDEDITLIRVQEGMEKKWLALRPSTQTNTSAIKELAQDERKTSIYTRQATLPLLVKAHEENNQSVTEQELKDLFAKTKYNYKFFNDEAFADVQIFAQDKNFKDINGKTIEQTKKIFIKKKKEI